MVERVRLTRKPAAPTAEVGYGKPPKQSQFKPGQSGNPKGRPKGTRNFKTEVHAMLEAPVTITRNGRTSKISTQRASLETLRVKALKGEQRPLEQVIRLGEKYTEPNVAVDAPLDGNDQAILDAYVQWRLQSKDAS
jgi:hypothetical protein